VTVAAAHEPFHCETSMRIAPLARISGKSRPDLGASLTEALWLWSYGSVRGVGMPSRAIMTEA